MCKNCEGTLRCSTSIADDCDLSPSPHRPWRYLISFSISTCVASATLHITFARSTTSTPSRISSHPSSYYELPTKTNSLPKHQNQYLEMRRKEKSKSKLIINHLS
mmetsp:Transcript_12482/g.20400  ORF Transcript_12482/g.20400 Transcript_12482/m.20400 type:complete len:105 (+) Transcript_12482:81-395(+)